MMKKATRRKKEKKILELTKRATDQFSEGILITNAKLDERKAKILYVNEMFCFMTGYSNDELVGKTINKLHGLKTDPEVLAQRRMTLSEGNIFTGKLIKYRKDGSEFYDEFDSLPMFDNKGNITNYMYIVRDVSGQVSAEKNNEALLRFVSRELKTPLTAIKGFVEIIEKNIQEKISDKHLEYFLLIKSEVDRLLRLTNTLFEKTQVKPIGVMPTKKPSDLDEIIRHVIKKIKSSANSHKIRRRGRINELVACDRDRIEQVVINLLTNAITYSPGAEHVFVMIKRENNQAIVSIQDFGIGIPAHKQENIFEHYYGNTDKNESVNSGLGLYIAAEIVRNHGGKIWVESREGKGSIFSFCLPLS